MLPEVRVEKQSRRNIHEQTYSCTVPTDTKTHTLMQDVQRQIHSRNNPHLSLDVYPLVHIHSNTDLHRHTHAHTITGTHRDADI